MKKALTIVYILISIPLITFIPGNVSAADSTVTVPVSLSYSSIYWWRGVELNGKGVGVIWPGAGLSIGDLSFNFAAGISEDWIVQEDSASKDYAKSISEVDYGISYSLAAGPVAIGFGGTYIQYPFYDEVNKDATNPSFIEGAISLGLKTILNPKVSFYYDYYVESYKNSSGDEVPQNEDYYVTFSLSQDLISTDDGFTFSLTGLVGYYNNAYLEREGFSDAVIRAEASKKYKDFTFVSNVNYGRTLGRDFRDANGGIKNNLWASFGISTILF
jgi:hypothetical protein